MNVKSLLKIRGTTFKRFSFKLTDRDKGVHLLRDHETDSDNHLDPGLHLAEISLPPKYIRLFQLFTSPYLP